jgi:predicted ABC-type ATPase
VAQASQPALVIVGGVNGCGKSTFARKANGTATLLHQAAINPDDLTLIAAKEAEARGFDLGQSGANLVAVERAEKAIWRAIANGESAAVETVLSSTKFLEVVKTARQQRYRTRLIFVALPTVELAVARVAARVNLGGHGVEEATIRSRWGRAHKNLVLFAELVDDVMVFSNETADPLLVAERVGRDQPMRLIEDKALPAVTRALLAAARPAG